MNEKPARPIRKIIKYVTDYLRSLPDLTGKVVVDIPCGDGKASRIVKEKGAIVKAFDLYPEFMNVEGVVAQYADMTESIPLEDESADYVICQEGIEHVSDQVGVLREFNRILKKNGELIISTPSRSHVRARLSHFFSESHSIKRFPPTVLDSVWFSEKESDRIYFGHLFLVGVQFLQTIASVCGFSVRKRIRTEIGSTSLCMGILLYPLFAFVTLVSYLLCRRDHAHVDPKARDRILMEHLRLNLSLKTLCCKHIFWVLRKEADLDATIHELKSMSKNV